MTEESAIKDFPMEKAMMSDMVRYMYVLIYYVLKFLADDKKNYGYYEYTYRI